MRMCAECGSIDMKKFVLPVYETDLGGIQVRLMNSVRREECGNCGEGTIEIPDLDGLSKATALARALVPIRLTGKEVRFMRLALDMTGREFADAMELSPETVSRWESGGRGVGGMSEKLLRHNICALLHDEVSSLSYEPAAITRMRIMDAPEDFVLPPLEFRRVLVKDRDESIETWDQKVLDRVA